jgi:lipopolysaccharide/colanic/teichoic acid biosynthesis glycosyltransferase
MIRQASNSKYIQLLNTERFSDLPFFRIMGALIKRSFDISFAALGLIFLLPLFVYIARRIKQDSLGAAFYWGSRVGMNGKPFKMLKFRTMYECATSYDGPSVTCKDDGRITSLGHWLRDTKINELPQLWNVLIGDMSLVGPRPEDPEIVHTWPTEARDEILSVRPGITSPASILYRDEENRLSASNVMGDYFKNILPDKMRLDRLYVRNRTFVADLDIIFWTIAILLPRVVKAPIREGYLFAGPLSRIIDRHVSWFLLDLLIAFGSGLTAELLWRIQEPLNWGVQNIIALSILIAILFSSMNVIGGLNRIVWAKAITEDAGGLMISAAITTSLTLWFNYLQSTYLWLPYPALPYTMIFTIGLMASIGFVVVRYRWRLITGFMSRWLSWRNSKGVVERVLIVGSRDGYDVANWLLKQGEGSHILSIVGVVDDEQPVMQGMRVKGNPFLGAFADIPALIRRYDVGVVLFAIPNATPELQETIARYSQQENTHMVFLSDLLTTLQKQLTSPQNKSRAA